MRVCFPWNPAVHDKEGGNRLQALGCVGCPLLIEVFLSPCWGQEDAALYRHLGALLRHCLMISADGEDRTEEFHRSVLGRASPGAPPGTSCLTFWVIGGDPADKQLLGLAWGSLTLLELRNSLSCPGNAMWECHHLLAPEILFHVLCQDVPMVTSMSVGKWPEKKCAALKCP